MVTYLATITCLTRPRCPGQLLLAVAGEVSIASQWCSSWWCSWWSSCAAHASASRDTVASTATSAATIITVGPGDFVGLRCAVVSSVSQDVGITRTLQTVGGRGSHARADVLSSDEVEVAVSQALRLHIAQLRGIRNYNRYLPTCW
jgi:hypothetical protein